MAAPPKRPALRARYERRRAEVVQVAVRLFAQRGYQATSMDDLVEATGIATGGLYHYIESKERLLIMILDQLMEPLLAIARALVEEDEEEDSSAEDRLRSLMRSWLSHVEQHQPHMLVFQQERHAIEHDSQWRHVRRQRKTFERLLARLLEGIDAEREHKFADRRIALLAVLGMVNYTPQWFDPSGRLTAHQIADHYADLLLGTCER